VIVVAFAGFASQGLESENRRLQEELIRSQSDLRSSLDEALKLINDCEWCHRSTLVIKVGAFHFLYGVNASLNEYAIKPWGYDAASPGVWTCVQGVIFPPLPPACS
jgi:hypothetical protein